MSHRRCTASNESGDFPHPGEGGRPSDLTAEDAGQLRHIDPMVAGANDEDRVVIDQEDEALGYRTKVTANGIRCIAGRLRPLGISNHCGGHPQPRGPFDDQLRARWQLAARSVHARLAGQPIDSLIMGLRRKYIDDESVDRHPDTHDTDRQRCKEPVIHTCPMPDPVPAAVENHAWYEHDIDVVEGHRDAAAIGLEEPESMSNEVRTVAIVQSEQVALFRARHEDAAPGEVVHGR